MAPIDYDGSGERQAECTAWTLVLYEQEFHADMIADVFGVIDARKRRVTLSDDGSVATIDYTNESWLKNVKALWALLRTHSDIAYAAGDLAPNDRIPGFMEWVRGVGKVNVDDISAFVVDQMNAGFFRDAAAASGTTSD